MEKGATNVKVPLISKIAYGMGDVGCNFSWMFGGCGRNPGPNEVINRRRSRTCIPTKTG